MKVESQSRKSSPNLSLARMRAARLAALKIQPESIFNHATALFDVWDNKSHQYVYVSEAVRSITGYGPEDFIGKGLDFVISRMHPQDRKTVIPKIDMARKRIEQYRPGIDDSKPFVTYEFRIRHKDGHYVWMHADSCVYSRTPDGKLQYVVSTGVKIDDQKAFERKLVHAAKRLEESQVRLQQEHERLLSLNSAKDEFVSIASHQLRTPASGVKQYLGLLLQNYVGPITDDQRRVLEAANEYNDRQIQIVTDLLNIAKLDAGTVQLHRAKADLCELVSDVVDEQNAKAQERHQRVEYVRKSDGGCTVSMDALLVRMVLENLVDNARKYSPENSDVEVCLSTDKQQAVVEVQDHGIGIMKKDQPKLFKKFSRIQNDQTSEISGTGLGLYWAKQIVDLHGGDLRLAKSSQSGSTFAFSLPLT